MINTNIYGLPENWTEAQYMEGAKYANFGTLAAPKNTLLEGSTAGKTPTGELIENSICTQALGAESLYSNIVWVHGNDPANWTIDQKSFVPYFYAENANTDDNIQNNEGYIISSSYNYNSWKPYVASADGFINKSGESSPIAEYDPKKVLYLMWITFCDEYGNRVGPYQLQRMNEPAEQAAIANYPYICKAALRPYVDISSTDTPNRTLINSNSLFGVCPNVNFNSSYDFVNINYAWFRSCSYNEIPIYGVFGLPVDDYYSSALCDKNDIFFDSNNYIQSKRLWNDDTKEFLIRQAACFGIFLRVGNTPNTPLASVALDNNDIICGLLDEQGVGHGDYTRGAANRTNPIWDWQTNRDSPFDPYKVPDPTIYNDKTVFGDNTLSTTFVQYYAMNKTGLDMLCTYIYNYINSIDTNVEDINKAISKTFYTNNPLDTIISLKMFPFNITDLVGGAPQNVKLGHLSTGGAGYKLNGSYSVIDFGSYPVYPVFGDCFLDYSPYTYFELIIPFCGSVRLDPAQFMGHTLNLKMAIDLYTGACTCYILSDNLCIDSVSGNCAVDMAITGIQSADFQNSVQNAITNVKNARINTATYNLKGELAMGFIGQKLFGNSAAKIGNFASSLMPTSLSGIKNLSGGIAEMQKTEAVNEMTVNQAEYNLQHLTTPFSSVGSQSAANCRMEEMQARLIIYRPEIAPDFNAEIYANTYGYATLENDVLNKYSGLTVAKVDLNGLRCSEEEKNMITSLFSQGVYL